MIFDVDDTYELLHCLEELQSWSKFESLPDEDESDGGLKSSLDEEKTGLLRLALARNLARALVETGPAISLSDS